MIQNLDILYSVASQSLWFDAPEGRPSSVTSSSVFENVDGDDSTAESALDGSASVETSLGGGFSGSTGAGQSDPNIISFDSPVTASVGRRYLVSGTSGESEWVEVVETDTLSARTRFPLEHAYSSGSLETTRITQALDDAWCADKNNISPGDPNPRYRWRLEYVVGGVTYVHQVFFDLVRYSATNTVKALDVDAAFPWLGFLRRLPIEDQGDRGVRVIGEAYRQVKLDFAASGKADQAARNREVFEDMVVHKAATLVLRPSEIDEFTFLEQRYNARLSNFVNVAKLPMDIDGSGAARKSDASPVWRR